MNISKVFFTALLGFFVFTLPACNVDDGKVTGGGHMASVASGQKANMGFNADSCSGTVTGRFNFHDAGFSGAKGGLKMMGIVTGVDKCTLDGEGKTERENMACTSSYYHSNEGCQEGYVVSMDYRSTNPKARGAGQAVACVLDGGKNATDGVWFSVKTGPFAGYYNHGQMKGNVQSHECDDA